MELLELYNKTRPIPKELQLYNKYTYGATLGLIEVRYLDVNDVFDKDTPITRYISENGQVLLFPVRVNDTITTIITRPLTTEVLASKKGGRPLTLGGAKFPYGIDLLRKEFKFGDPIIIVEGIGDLLGLKMINEQYDVIAIQSNSISKEYVDVLTSITNNFILLLDNDDAGRQGTYRVERDLKAEGASVVKLDQYVALKDTGDIVDKVMEVNRKGEGVEELTIIVNYYHALLKQYIK